MTQLDLATLRQEFRANPRLRIGVWVVFGIVWLYGLLLLDESLADKSAQHRALLKKISRAEALAVNKQWTERSEEAQALLKQAQARLWREQTSGLAQAAFQDWLNQTVAQTALVRPQVTVSVQEAVTDKSVPDEEKLWKVSAKLSFDFQPANLATLLGKLATNEKRVVVESLSVRTVPSPRADMLMVAYFAQSTKESLR